MKLKSFRVRLFGNVVDSGEIPVDEAITCLVGKNEAGKSCVLEALYLLNPAGGERFDAQQQYPRWRLSRDRELARSGKGSGPDEAMPIEARFELTREESARVESCLGRGALEMPEIRVGKNYGNRTHWHFWPDETAIVKHLLGGVPSSVRAIVGSPTTVDLLIDRISRLRLGEGKPDAENAALDRETLSKIEQAVISAGLDGAKLFDVLVDTVAGSLPRFFRFDEYDTLPGRVSLEDLARGEEQPGRPGVRAARALLRRAGADLDRLNDEDFELQMPELEALQMELSDEISTYWKQNPHLKLEIKLERRPILAARAPTAIARTLNLRLVDARTGFSNDFERRSSGFRWFFSLLVASREFEDEAPDALVVLLDEPAIALHGKAQRDFMAFVSVRLSKAHPVIYTTHSPFMIEPDDLGRVRVVEDEGPPVGAVVHADVLGSNPDSALPMQAALGHDIAQSVLVGPDNLLVEGSSIRTYLTSLSRQLAEKGRRGLDPRWRLLSIGGGMNATTFLVLLGARLDATVLIDSGGHDMKRLDKLIDRKLLSAKRLVRVGDVTADPRADVEDLFAEDDYLKLYNAAFRTRVRAHKLPVGPRIVKRLEAHGEPFDRDRVAEALLRKPFAMSEDTLGRFEALFGAINATLTG